MEITEVRIRRHRSDDGKLKAFASVVFDSQFVVHDMKIISGVRGLFVAMPSRKRPDGSHEDIAHPVSREFRQRIQDTLINKYNEEVEPPGDTTTEPQPPVEV
jgi:stage V sporulation protein G